MFRTVLSDGTVRYILGDGTPAEISTDAFNATELARLNTMLADFGFSTADNYTYKLEDKYFTSAGADCDVLTATYNNGTVVPVEPDEENPTMAKRPTTKISMRILTRSRKAKTSSRTMSLRPAISLPTSLSL